MMKLPEPAQLASPAPPDKVQVPTTTPLLNVPVTCGVPFDVPVTLPVIVRTLPGGDIDVTLKLKVPVTWSAAPVIRVAVPVSLEPGASIVPMAKHLPPLKKSKPVMSSGPVSYILNAVTKFSRLD